MRAARALAESTGLGPPTASIRLEKNLPVASGIGGGSADAAATLKALCKMWSSEMDDAELSRIGLSLGADVPVCLLSRTARFSGIGETVETGAPLPPAGVLLVNPGVSVATAGVFARRAGPFSGVASQSGPWADAASMADGLRKSRNDLAEPAAAIAPVINDVLNRISEQPGCLLARMSGSGATCFGIFPDDAAARDAQRAIAEAKRSWWVRATRFQQ